MKFTDGAILFLILMLAFVIPLDGRLQLLMHLQMQKTMYNAILDTAVEDSLRNGVVITGKQVSMNHQMIVRQFERSLQELLVTEISSEHYPVMMITDGNACYFWENNQEKKIVYPELGTREDKINLIRTEMEKRLSKGTALQVSIPYVEAEEWYNTVSDMGFLVIYRNDRGMSLALGNGYEQRIAAGAAYRREIAEEKQ